MNGLLELRGVHAWYGRAHVLQGVDLHVAPGEIVALLGRNGAGRSTLARAVMGLVERRGRMLWRGQDIGRLRTFEIARMGIGYVPESRDIFPGMTVEQNLVLGQKAARAGRWAIADVYRLFPPLGRRANVQAQHLSGGEQQMLALGRTLMGDPALMLVDEPAEGLAPLVVAQLAACLDELRRQGMAILLIEQKLDFALDIADRAYVLGHGTVVFAGTPAALRADGPVRREWIEF
ncbi:ABC transporter ATP-binding protein [Pigmentiphaga sp. H8]|uniref:ABC transporter ATP-binding protein n=1 Tax=unclassified Pigmentiphaga TaxID=2626614 RepID=UPI000F59B912|nr:ABC transporter ATP-binding protein [Pigmentiphaga sp. H8]AZG09135.1 ABC transporter ATP-binding protein [Pigmentiphaga sp. H8]